jgi:transposase-like protein
MATRKHFTKEFKLEAIRLVEHSGKSGTELARQLGVRRNQLYKWQSELRGRAERAFPGRGPHPESDSRTGSGLAFCLLKTKDLNIPQDYNRRQSRLGAFWEDRNHATAIESGAHLHRCLVCVDLNMVRAGVVS